MNGDVGLDNREDIIKHILDYFISLYSKDSWIRPLLDNLNFASIGNDKAIWLEKAFEEDEVCQAVFDLGGDKAVGPDGFPIIFFQRFWVDVKEDIMAFMEEFHSRGRLSKNIGVSFIVLIPKKLGAECLKYFRPISLLGNEPH